MAVPVAVAELTVQLFGLPVQEQQTRVIMAAQTVRFLQLPRSLLVVVAVLLKQAKILQPLISPVLEATV
jgi:hypothetical protein